jgi:hypothetical protein
MVRHSLIVWLSVASAALVANPAPSQARHARHVRLIADTLVCTPIPRVAPDIAPAPNWEPFFRHHYYQYWPITRCMPATVSAVATTEPVVSVRY